MATKSIDKGASPLLHPTIKTKKHIKKITTDNFLLNSVIFFFKGLSTSFFANKPAILPNSVAIPVSVTIPFALPWATIEPLKAILFLSANETPS